MADEPAPFYAITVSRQFGSLGREIARHVARKLGIDYYDRDLIEKAAAMLGCDMRQISPLDEYVKLPFASALLPLGLGGRAAHKRLFEAQRSLILDSVQRGCCVIVGRCADYVLKDYPRRFSVMIYAPLKARIRNSINELRIPDFEVDSYVRKIDRARDAYYRLFTGQHLTTIENRDLLIDSSSMGIDEAADVIIAAARAKLRIPKLD
ncbi:MAG: cytidylate kinase-like family protein [Aeromonadales bacterium]|nr:cytidylate kinase-like family protein [Aeromonadales bacterium]MDY2891984.1 cytidylate kinase-like family protein [Succinivibrio sp.]